MPARPQPLRLSAADGTLLHAERALPSGTPALRVALIHGFGEHLGRYHHVMRWLQARGAEVVGVDLRGHGHSTGRRSFVRSYDDYLADVDALVTEIRASERPAPLFLLGHSMGGLIATRYAQTRAPELAGLVLSSPAFGFAVAVPPLKKAVGKVMSRYWPSLSLPAGVPSRALSHDPKVVADYDADPLVNKNATARWYTASLDAQKEAMRDAPALHVPALGLLAGADEVANTYASIDFFQQLGSEDKAFEVLEGLYHEVLNEPEWEQALGTAWTWMQARAAASEGTRDASRPANQETAG